MRVLIIGATGPTGRELVSQALALGHTVTALVRRPEAAHLPDETRIVRGDIMDPPSLTDAVIGQQTIVSSLGSKLSRKPTTLFSAGTRNLLAAMRSASVRRLICITGIGAGDSRGHGGFLYDKIFQPLLLNEIYLDKDRQEALIRASTADWTLVRPGMLTDGPRTGVYKEVKALDGVKIGKISRADVAAFILKNLEEASTFHQTFNLTY